MPNIQHHSVIDQIEQMFASGDLVGARNLLKEVFKSYESNVGHLEDQIAKLRHRIFGRRTERISTDQLKLFEQAANDGEGDATENGNEDADGVLSEEEAVLVKEHRRKRKKNQTSLDLSGLPTEQVTLEVLEKDCSCCGSEKKVIGYEETTAIERNPSSVTVKVYRRPKTACANCKGAGVDVVPAPKKPLKGSPLSFSLLVDIIIAKFGNHIPLNRLQHMYSQEGLCIPYNTLVEWVGLAADLLNPIARAILTRSLNSVVVQTDDTPVTVLDREAPGGSKKGRLWVYLGDGRWVAFDYTPDWRAERPRELLKKRRGAIQADGYKGYEILFDDGRERFEVGCWSHARRKFVDALINDKRAAKPLLYIKQLFKIEQLAAAKNMNVEQRLELRQSRSVVITKKLAACLGKLRQDLTPKDDLTSAVNYVENRWGALTEFLGNGHLELTNNAAERALRSIAVGRANWQFAGSDIGGARAAVLYTVCATAAAFGIDVRQYLEAVLTRMVDGAPDDINQVLPTAFMEQEAQKDAA